MKPTSKGTEMKTLLPLLALASMSLSIGTTQLHANPLSDCYDDAIAACGFLWPGQDSGDDGYASCVSSGMDLCDGAHSSKPKPLGLTGAPTKKPLSKRVN
jgi:hypothetical protein